MYAATSKPSTPPAKRVAKGVASILGGWVGALLYEQSGSWTMGFYGSALMALIAAVMAVKLRGSAASSRVMVAAPAAVK